MDSHFDIMILRSYTLSQNKSTEPQYAQYGYSHLDVYDIMIHSSYTVPQKRSTEPQYGYNHLDAYDINDACLLHGVPKKVHGTLVWVQPFRCLKHKVH